RDHTARHSVVLGENGVNGVVIGGQALLHVRLGVLGLPAVRVGLADDLDLARRDIGAYHFFHALAQEVGIRVARVTLDDRIVSFGLGGLHGFGDDAPDALVVEGQVEGTVVLDQAVVTDNRNAFCRGLVDCGADRILVHGEDDQRLGPLGDE